MTQRPRPRAANLYAGRCVRCANTVPAAQGFRARNDSGGWTVVHADDAACDAAVDAARAARAAAPPAVAAPLIAVPTGHYAVASATGHNDLDFYRVERPTEGRWAGRTFVRRVIGGRPAVPVRGAEARVALARIDDAGVDACAARYGIELGRCYRCNRHLTDRVSRMLGIGPDCRRLVEGSRAVALTALARSKGRLVVRYGECARCAGVHNANALCPATDPAAYAAWLTAALAVTA